MLVQAWQRVYKPELALLRGESSVSGGNHFRLGRGEGRHMRP